MKYSLKSVGSSYSDTTAMVLSFPADESYYSLSKRTEEVSGKFLQSAVLLPEGCFLSWQFSAEEEHFSSYVIADKDSSVTAADISWIFRSCANVSAVPSASMPDLFEENRRVYILSSTVGSALDISVPAHRYAYLYDEYDDGMNDRFLDELLELLKDAGARIRIAAGAVGENERGHGAILISLRKCMSLRLRSILSLTFPHTSVEVLNISPQEQNNITVLPDECVMKSLSRLLCALIYRYKQEQKDAQSKDSGDEADPEFELTPLILSDDSDDETDTPSTCTPIEKLELSIRAYNCLRRAGITTVEELLKRSDEELTHVRNLGRKGFQEVKQKAAEFHDFMPVIPPQSINYTAMLDELIGLADVKDHIRKITAFARMKQDMEAKGMDSLSTTLNMAFIGNPGTAKTTVARILAGIFHEIGLLSNEELVEVGRADLVARYEGQTADKVKEVFCKARGRLLFIDEAYSLLENHEGEYGDEAINTIVQEMENHRADTVVIFAGYPKPMEQFLSRNPGLRSRVPFSINFNDYSVDELLKIVELEAQKRGFAVSTEARETVTAICRTAVGSPKAGNGRFCRNLVENAVLLYASRVYAADSSGPVEENDFKLIPVDFALPKDTGKIQKSPLGFLAG